MPVIDIEQADDPRILPYHALRGERREPDARFFLCEGVTLVERLLASRFEVDSLLVTRRRTARLPGGIPERVAVYVIPDELLPRIAGRGYKNGMYARARRPFVPAAWQPPPGEPPERLTLLMLPRLTFAANVGSIARSAAALGADALLVGPACADPFHHQSVRASMGALFTLPVVCAPDPVAEVARLRATRGFEVTGAVLSDDAQALERFVPVRSGAVRNLIVMGNEFDGLDPAFLPLCDHRLTAPMANGVDSLNVAMAATVFLYEFLRKRGHNGS